MILSLKERVRFRMLALLDTVVMLKPAKRDPSKVLIVRLDGIGDFVLWLDAAKTLCDHYRRLGKHVTAVGDSSWAKWARELNLFDEVISLDRKKFGRDLSYRRKLLQQIRGLGCTLAVHPQYSRSFWAGDSVMRTCGAKVRIGSIGEFSNITEAHKKISDRWYTQLIAACTEPLMELSRNAEFIRNLLDPDYKSKVANLHEIVQLKLDEQFASELSPGERYWVAFPGASFGWKLWPLAHFAEIATRIYEETGWRGIVCGGPGDAELTRAMCESVPVPLLNWTGRTSLTQFAAILAEAELVLSNDTSAVHISAAVGTPVVCILAGAQYGRFLPYEVEHKDGRPVPQVAIHSMPCFGCEWACIFDLPDQQAKPCVDQVTVDDVWMLLRGILNHQHFAMIS